jgi:hypothetical protein
MLTEELFREACAEIDRAYQQLGHKIGWRFLMGPKSTFNSSTDIAFISLNPGGDIDPPDHPHESQERGSAYIVESWGNKEPGCASLQIQVQRLFGKIASYKSYPGDVKSFLANDVLAAYFIPFRSPRFATLHEKNPSIKYGRDLWSKLLAVWMPSLIITIDTYAYNSITNILGAARGAILKQEGALPTGWGDIQFYWTRLAVPANNQPNTRKDTIIAKLPHLSTFKLFSNPNCTPHIDSFIETILADTTK